MDLNATFKYKALKGSTFSSIFGVFSGFNLVLSSPIHAYVSDDNLETFELAAESFDVLWNSATAMQASTLTFDLVWRNRPSLSLTFSLEEQTVLITVDLEDYLAGGKLIDERLHEFWELSSKLASGTGADCFAVGCELSSSDLTQNTDFRATDPPNYESLRENVLQEFGA